MTSIKRSAKLLIRQSFEELVKNSERTAISLSWIWFQVLDGLGFR